MEEYKESTDEIEIDLEELSEEETEILFSTVLDSDGTLSLNKIHPKTITRKDKGKYYIAGTITGYEDKFDRPVYFCEGAHEEALPYWKGKKLFTFHKDDKYPLGKFEEAFMDGPNVKILGWTDDKELYDVVKSGKMNELSGRIVPKKVIYNRKKKKFGIVTYRPKEGSMVNFQGYEPAKIEIIGTNREKIREILMNESKDETIVLKKDEQEISMSEEKFDEKDQKILELEKKLKVIKFKEKHEDAINLDKVTEFMLKYEVSDEDAEQMLVKEEKKEADEVIKIAPSEQVKEKDKLDEDRTNKAVPRAVEEIAEPPKEKTELEKFRETLDARVEHAFRRGYK